MKLIGLLDLPGAGTGPLRQRSPQARLCIGCLMLLAVILAPLTLPVGLLAVSAMTVFIVLIAGTPSRLIVRTMLVFAVLYVPFLAFLLLSRLLSGEGPGTWLAGSSIQVGQIALRALAILIVSAAVVSTLPIADVIRGGSALPIPRIVVTMLFHILHQSSLMARETASIAQAVAVRGGSRGSGSEPSWRVRYRPSGCRAWKHVSSARRAQPMCAAQTMGPWRQGNLPGVATICRSSWQPAA